MLWGGALGRRGIDPGGIDGGLGFDVGLGPLEADLGRILEHHVDGWEAELFEGDVGVESGKGLFDFVGLVGEFLEGVEGLVVGGEANGGSVLGVFGELAVGEEFAMGVEAGVPVDEDDAELLEVEAAPGHLGEIEGGGGFGKGQAGLLEALEDVGAGGFGAGGDEIDHPLDGLFFGHGKAPDAKCVGSVTPEAGRASGIKTQNAKIKRGRDRVPFFNPE